MPKQVYFTQEEKEAILGDYLEGMTWYELTRKYRHAVRTLMQYIPHHLLRRVQKPHKTLTEREKEQLVEDRKNGITYAALRNKYGICRTCVGRIVPRELKQVRSNADFRRDEAILEYLKEDTKSVVAACAITHATPKCVRKQAQELFPEKFRRFDSDFRKKVVFDAIGTPVREIAKLYGLSSATIYLWKRLDRDGLLDTRNEYHLKKPAGN